MAALPRGSLEVIGVAGPEACDYLISPIVRAGAHPVLFLLHGHQEISRVDRLERLLEGPEALDRFVLEHFHVVLPIFRWDGALVHDHAVNVEALWALVQAVLRRLGSRADAARLCFTGYSMGADALMKLACRYGSHIAAAVPFAGSYDAMWYEPEEDMVPQLRDLAIRAYHSGRDNHVSPRNCWRMMKWLGGECGPGQEWREVVVEDPDLLAKVPPEHEDIVFDVTAFDDGRKEHWSVRDALWHNCWECVYHHEATFGLFRWLLEQRNSRACRPVVDVRFKAALECSPEWQSQHGVGTASQAADCPAPAPAGPAPSYLDRGTCSELLPGRYRLIDECVVGSGMRLHSRDVAELAPATEVDVLEVRVCEEDRRVRGRIQSPPGWISLVDMEDCCWWVWPLESAMPPLRADAGPDGASDSEAPPLSGAAAALHCGLSEGRLLVGTLGDGTEPEPLARWNGAQRRQGRRRQCIRVGDEIIAVNGQSKARAMLRELEQPCAQVNLEVFRAWSCGALEPTQGGAPSALQGGAGQRQAQPPEPGGAPPLASLRERQAFWESLRPAADAGAARRPAQKPVPKQPKAPAEAPRKAEVKAPAALAAPGAGHEAERIPEAPPAPPPKGKPQLTWRVVGGVDAGGIVVRHGFELTATIVGRLETGALVLELDLMGERLHYKKVVPAMWRFDNGPALMNL